MIYVVGLGPGDEKFLTPQARAAIENSEVIVGYDLYVELIRPLTEGKIVASTPMKKEVDRCEIALDYAKKGHSVAMVCSGDAGVYGMAGVMLEVAEQSPEIDIEIVPGITAALSGAAALGAPLTHDFAVISLSDLLTPMEKIEKRLRCAAMADFVVCIYNPQSKKRSDYLQRAADILMETKGSETPCGYVKHIGRAGEEIHTCTLAELGAQPVDMFTTVIVGNSQTKLIHDKMVTPRGYRGL